MALRRLATLLPVRAIGTLSVAPAANTRSFSTTNAQKPKTNNKSDGDNSDDSHTIKSNYLQAYYYDKSSGSLKQQPITLEEYEQTKLGKAVKGVASVGDSEAAHFEVAMPGVCKADIEVTIVDGYIIKIEGVGYQGGHAFTIAPNPDSYNVAETKAKMDIDKGAVLITVPRRKDGDQKKEVVEIQID